MSCCFRMKDGETMSHYCKRNGLYYNSLFRLVDTYGLTPEEAVKRYKNMPRKVRKFFYNGKSLYRYCIDKYNDRISYVVISNDIKRRKITVDEAVAHYEERKNK